MLTERGAPLCKRLTSTCNRPCISVHERRSGLFIAGASSLFGIVDYRSRVRSAGTVAGMWGYKVSSLLCAVPLEVAVQGIVVGCIYLIDI